MFSERRRSRPRACSCGWPLLTLRPPAGAAGFIRAAGEPAPVLSVPRPSDPFSESNTKDLLTN